MRIIVTRGLIDKTLFLAVGIVFLFMVLGGLTITSISASGVNITNATIVSKVNVVNTEPTLYRVDITSATPVELSAGSTVMVNCTGSVYDTNGWDDIKNVSASFYNVDNGDGNTSDNNFRYLNRTCGNCTQIASTNASCSCMFDIRYYANNGSWRCNMTIWDSYRLNSTENSSIIDVSTVLGLDVPLLLDYGNLSVTETSPSMALNITNWGNVAINISVRGFGGDDNSVPQSANMSMVCSNPLSINISSGFERYYLQNVSFVNMTNISNSSMPISNFTIIARTNDTSPHVGADRNFTFWRLQVPTGVTGTCNGTIIFSATDAS